MNLKNMLAIIVALLMIVSGATLLFSGTPQSHGNNISASSGISMTQAASPAPQTTPSATTNQVTPGGTSQASGFLHYAKAHNIPTKYVYLPNFMSTSKVSNGHITPGYQFAPAPMGIGDYGLYNNSGVISTYNYTTSSYEAQINLSYLNDFYLLDNFPTTVTFQLNAVLNNVALFGNSSYQMWTQNVVDFSSRTMTLQFVDNVWNFSNPNTYLTSNAINYSSAQAAGLGATGGGYHYGISPVFNVSYPLVLTLYMNTTLNNGRSTVYYNYTLPGVGSGTYDEVIFNSTYGVPSYTAPSPHYLVSGTQLTNTGFIPFDAEVMIGGPGGGSTATIYGINGTMNLKSYNNTTHSYQNARAAYDIGSETGETSVGVDVSYTGSTAHLSAGPSLVYGLWNNTYSQTKYNVTSNPFNAFIFAQNNATLEAANIWAWAPMPSSGIETFTLPTSNYSYLAMLNDFNEAKGTLSASTTITMTANFTKGIYTPVIAMNNAQLTTLVSQLGGTGLGTQASPYVIAVHSSGLDPTFGSMNDYSFPAFPGIMILNTTSYLNIENINLTINYTGFNAQVITFFETLAGLAPQAQFLTNSLSVQLYNDSNITISHSFGLQTWYSFEISQYFYTGAINIWNSTNINVSDNLLVSEGISVLIYNAPYQPGSNIVWGNLFLGYSVLDNITPNGNASYLGLATFVGNFYLQAGVYVISGGNAIYGNVFLTQTPVVNQLYNIWTGGFNNSYVNTWDSPTNSSNDMSSVAIIPLFQFDGRGNWYWNYNGMDTTYNGYGAIAIGGDTSPGKLVNGSDVLFVAQNVYPELNFVADLGGLVISSSTSTSIEFFDFPTTLIPYYFNYTSTAQSTTGSGMVSISVAGQIEEITFKEVPVPVTFSVIFTESGLAAGTSWTVDFGGTAQASTGTTITFSGVMNGSHTYYVPAVSGYGITIPGGEVTVNGANASVAVSFTTFEVVFTETGLSSSTTWTVVFNGTTYTNNTTTITISGLLSQRSYLYTIGNVSGYASSQSTGVLVLNGNSYIGVAFSSPPSTTSSLTPYEYLGVGAVIGLIIGGLAVFFIRKPPTAQP